MRLPKESEQNNKNIDGGGRTNLGNSDLNAKGWETGPHEENRDAAARDMGETDCDVLEATVVFLVDGSFVSCAYIRGNADSLKLIF